MAYKFSQAKLAKKTRIMVFGTFDILHKGHLHFFKQARKLAAKPYLIVSVARDKNVERIKGFKPLFREKKRLKDAAAAQGVDLAVLGALGNPLPHIKKQRPDIIALGYDQGKYVNNLATRLKQAGIKARIRRLKAYKPSIYKSSLLK